MSPPHPEAPEGSLQQLDLNADNPKSAAFEQHQHQKQQQQQQPDPEPPAALQNTACLAATFSWLDTEQSLLQCSAVCRLWHSVLEADDIWSRVYLRSLPEPLPFERVGSYRQQFQRLRGLLNPPDVQPTALKGSALCYNAATGHLVSYNARQRVISVLMADGSIRSEIVSEAEGTAGTAHRPLLASTGSELVVLAAADGALQLWSVTSCVCAGVLGHHGSFVTSLSASGGLVASSCSREMRLWEVHSKTCLYTVPIGLPLPSPVLEPHVAVCHEQQLLALANCAAPAPCSVVKVYSTHPALASNPNAAHNAHSSRRSPSAAAANDQAAAAAAAAAVSVVGDSSCPGAVGALLLKELPVNAAADMKLSQGLLFVASCFHGRAVSTNSPFKSERPYTVVVNVWETRTWQLTRLISPRLWTDTPMFSMQGTPLISISQGVVLCATLRSGCNNAFPSCAIHALQLQPAVATAGVLRNAEDSAQQQPCSSSSNGAGGGSSSSSRRHEPADHGGSSTGAGSTGLCFVNSGSNPNSGSNSQPESSNIGTGAIAQGRIAVATAGGVGPVGLSSSNTVMLSVSDRERLSWSGKVPLVDDTGGRLAVLLTTPTQLVMATENGQVLCSRLMPAQQEASSSAMEGQQQEGGGESPERAAAAAGGSRSSSVSPVVHVLEPHAGGNRFISLDL